MTFLPGTRAFALAGSLLILGTIPAISQGQKQPWSEITASQLATQTHRDRLPVEYKAIDVDLEALRFMLAAAPAEGTAEARTAPLEVSIPMPDGSSSKFRIVEAPVMAPALAARYPEIKTYAGQGIDDRTATIRIDVSPAGLHSQILSAEGAFYIDPYSNTNATQHMVYSRASLTAAGSHEACSFTPVPDPELEQSLAAARLANTGFSQSGSANRSHGTDLRTYRLALACTGEYAASKGGTKAGALAGMVTSMNRVNGIYEKELAIRMVLIPNNDTLIFLNASTDPYTNNSGGIMLGQNQTTVDALIGNANYDIGHVFSTGGGGVAGLGVICRPNQKARGVTGRPNPTGDPFDVDYVAHEIGHQFGATHTFNGNATACAGNGSAATAYEPGSGTTIMAYAGICGSHNLAANSSPYFHTASFDQIVTYTTTSFGNTCPVITSTGNTPPLVPEGQEYYIPLLTPFILTEKGVSDTDGDSVTYCFEQFDKGPFGHPNTPSGNAPIFRSFLPGTSDFRYFPRLTTIIANSSPIGERLPSYARILHFRLTARDNRADGGGVTYNEILFTVNAVDTGSPFLVTSPNTPVVWGGMETRTVTWDVADTDLPPINATHVHIMLSTDGGHTFTDTLAANVPNTGSYDIVVPDINTNTARIIVAGAGNIFFDMSNTNFTISVVSGLADQLSAPAFTIFPNPTEGEFNLALTNETHGTVMIQVLDMLGREVYTTSQYKNSQVLNHTVDLSAYPKGIYLVQVSTTSGKALQRIVKL